MKDLLTAISSAKVDDERGLDEIDALVHSFLVNREFKQIGDGRCYYHDKGYTNSDHVSAYSRSRDALKGIRPKGWYFNGVRFNVFGASAVFHKLDEKMLRTEVFSSGLPSEELAELYCIIAAIQHDRANTEGGDE
jgi:hypothetical protein